MLSALFKKENCIAITKILLARLNVPVTDSGLEQDLHNHPDYPSLLSVSDVLNRYGVANISIKTSAEQLDQLPMPAVLPVRTQSRKDLFTIITEVKDGVITVYDPENHTWQRSSATELEKTWVSGIALLTEAEEAHGEKDHTVKRRNERRENIIHYATWAAVPALAIFAAVIALVTNHGAAAWPVLYLVLTLLGCTINGLLLWYELDEFNPVLQQICSAGKKTNCGAILNSKASKIAGISWSTIGFTYFAGNLLTLLSVGIAHPTALFVVAWINLFAVPYVFYSIYYQWGVAKQWCVLCLTVQALLVLQLVTALIGGWHSLGQALPLLTPANATPLVLSFVLPFLMVNLLMPAYKAVKEGKRYKVDLLRLKHDPLVFNALLSKQKIVTESTDGLGITIGDPNAKHTLIKVCGPYCGPCSSAHPIIEDLIENNPDIKLQIIFNAYDHGHDLNADPAKHLIAIAQQNDEHFTKQALNDWYLADVKDYDAFAGKYPLGDLVDAQIGKITSMRNWCDKTDITFTPTFFLNGQQLPDNYSVADLKYYLSV